MRFTASILILLLTLGANRRCHAREQTSAAVRGRSATKTQSELLGENLSAASIDGIIDQELKQLDERTSPFSSYGLRRQLQTCGTEGNQAKECEGVNNPNKPSFCCNGLVCSGKICVAESTTTTEGPSTTTQAAATTCSTVGQQANECPGVNNAQKPQTCCAGLTCEGRKCVASATTTTTTQAPTTESITTTQNPSTTTQAPATTTGSESNARDIHGIKYLYASDGAKAANNWVSNWDNRAGTDLLSSAFTEDTGDPRAMMRGSGSIEIGVNGEETRMINSPRLYIEAAQGYGYENVEFTAYGTWKNNGKTKNYSGLTMVARTNHGNFQDGCTGPGYMARIYHNTGEVSLQKEYFHEQYSIYSNSRRVDVYWTGGLPTDEEVGIKFIVLTQRAGNRNFGANDVVLQIWIDRTGGLNGGLWNLVHEVVDSPGTWMKSSGNDIADRCEVQDGDTVIGARQLCFLRGDGSSGTEISWRKASIRNITPDMVNTQ